MNNVDLSIIIPHYNSPVLLKRLLSSIGTHNNVEIIVIDDNSDKDLEEYENCKSSFSHVSFLTNSTGVKGAGSSRNIGLENANGRWIVFADSDDVFLDNWYKKVSRFFSSDADVCFFVPTSKNFQKSTSSSRHIQYAHLVNNYINKEKNSEVNLRFGHLVPWSKMIKNRLIKDHGIRFDQVIVSNDVMFSVKVGYYAKKIICDKSCFYCVTETEGSLIKNPKEEMFRVRCEIECERWKFCSKRLNQSQLDCLFKWSALKRIGVVIKRRYGIKTALKYKNLFKKTGYPIFRFKWIYGSK